MTTDLRRARGRLRSFQARWGGHAHDSVGPVTDSALSWLSTWPVAVDVVNGTHVNGIVRRRFQRTVAIIERVDPGPHEHAQLLTTLAWQAGVIELTVASDEGLTERLGEWPLIGSVREPRSHARTSFAYGYPIVEMSAGLITSTYALAKAAVLSWKPIYENQGLIVGFSAHSDDIDAMLDTDPRPVTLVVDALINWIRDARAGQTPSSPVREELETPLASLVSSAERFILAHEYWHALNDHDHDHDETTRIDRELDADLFAWRLTLRSAQEFDQTPADVAMQGCLLAMEVHAIADDLLHLAGIVRDSPTTHPEMSRRAERLLDAYRAEYIDTGRVESHVAVAFVGAVAAAKLWQRARPSVTQELSRGAQAHRLWN